MKRIFFLFLLATAAASFSFKSVANTDSHMASREYIELRVYHFTTNQQVATVDSFLKLALLPALHEAGITKVGIFTPVDNDTATDKKIYLLIPYSSLKQFEKLPDQLKKNKTYSIAGASYLNAVYNQAPYTRFENILLYAFPDMPQIKPSGLTTSKSNRVYELRSYESSTEKIHENKVEMFNKGGEVSLFQRLGFNAVFYAQVISGSRMPNLMYMTSFENKASRDEHWKQFSADPFWKTLSAKPEYQHNVSKIDITFLTPAEYSDL